jgi:hypothetical protein
MHFPTLGLLGPGKLVSTGNPFGLTAHGAVSAFISPPRGAVSTAGRAPAFSRCVRLVR